MSSGTVLLRVGEIILLDRMSYIWVLFAQGMAGLCNKLPLPLLLSCLLLLDYVINDLAKIHVVFECVMVSGLR